MAAANFLTDFRDVLSSNRAVDTGEVNRGFHQYLQRITGGSISFTQRLLPSKFLAISLLM